MASPTERPTVLLVEDDADIRDALVDVLREEGYSAVTAEHGREALRMLRQGFRPGLILLDLMMPEMNGWEFRAIQRQDKSIADIPVMLLSVAADGFAASCLDAVGYVRKPLGLAALAALRSALSHHCGPVHAEAGGAPAG